MALLLLKSVLVVAVFSIFSIAQASDPDILSDFIVPAGSAIDGNLFTFNGTRGIFGSIIEKFKVTKASKAEFPVLDGQSVSLAVLQFPGGGLVHYQYNSDWNKSATAVSAFGSANAGTVSLPTTLFATGIDDQILAKSFKSDVATIQKMKAGLSS
ncbi:hypothetical protein K7X08_028017 [Anisodus acutangulus]|uniref:Cupin type-1 domain-containing protein n=1 Tax=Anisodus acutangulus TaxID=402998 RepID=A0A9Q1RR93_9SOLA|nr:hypothetical protein K7X08_028017 [Anisodus acutangulus]